MPAWGSHVFNVAVPEDAPERSPAEAELSAAPAMS